MRAAGSSTRATTSAGRTPPAPPLHLSLRPLHHGSHLGLPVFRHPPAEAEIGKLLHSCQLFPERCHVVGAYSLGKAQRVIALLRQAGYDRPIYIHGALAQMCELYEAHGVRLGELRAATAGARGEARKELEGQIVIALRRHGRPFGPPPPEPVDAHASGWMRVEQRGKAGDRAGS